MYAVVMLQGHQFRVEPQALIQVPRLEAQVGTEVPIDNVLLVEGDGAVQVGKPVVNGAKVVAEVVRHLRGPKVKGVKFKKRKDYRRRWGQRSDLTELRIRSITTG
ncbi:MAG TPA: 50S ribosomal protein L21 [Candidatus Udaeobacter sp.]|nr:50S ribosomal protein L21 [Candidatus Udaeobacter sp.]